MPKKSFWQTVIGAANKIGETITETIRELSGLGRETVPSEPIIETPSEVVPPEPDEQIPETAIDAPLEEFLTKTGFSVVIEVEPEGTDEDETDDEDPRVIEASESDFDPKERRKSFPTALDAFNYASPIPVPTQVIKRPDGLYQVIVLYD